MTYSMAAVASLRRELQKARENPTPVYGLSTGIRSVDLRTKGLQAGEMTVLAGRSGHGKSAMAAQWSFHVAEEALAAGREGVVLYFSAEMRATRLLARELAGRTGISVARQQAAEYTADEGYLIEQTLDTLSQLPIVVLDKAAISTDIIRETVGNYYHTDGLLLVVVDHLQLAVKRGGQRQYEATTETIHALRELRDVVEAPILVLSQLRRPTEGKDSRPDLSDLRDSGAIEEDANNVYILFSPPSAEDDDEDGSRPAELIIRKARDGWTGTIHLQFETSRCAFVEANAPPVIELPSQQVVQEEILREQVLMAALAMPRALDAAPQPFVPRGVNG